MDVVREVLGSVAVQNQNNRKTIEVEKHLECRLDVGTMLCNDPNDIDYMELKKDKTNYLLSLTRDNTQLLINSIWKLPTERFEECIVAKLPEPSVVLPRQRKVPGPKKLTKWEKFALEKGIKKTKKAKKVYDEVLDKWVPTYGYKSAEAKKAKDWVLEVPQNADPNIDMFQQKMDLHNEKVAKNEIQRMKNIARAHHESAPRVGYLGADSSYSKQLLTAVTVAKSSTASVGKFQSKLPKEKEARGIGVRELIPGKKRKASHIAPVREKEANMDLINSVLNKTPKINVDKAITLQKQEVKDTEQSAKKSKGSKRGGGKKSSSKKKPKGGQGLRAPSKKKAVGRKRR